MSILLIAGAAFGVFLIGCLVGVVLVLVTPPRIETWRASQRAYAKGYEAGLMSVRAIVRKAAKHITGCRHIDGNRVCSSCASLTSGELAKLLRDD